MKGTSEGAVSIDGAKGVDSAMANASRATRLRRQLRPGPEMILAVVSPLVLLGAWELLAYAEVIDTRFFSQPTQIFATLGEMASSGELTEHVTASLRRVALGLVIGVVPGTLLGAVMGLSRLVRAIFLPVIAATFPIPKIAILPLLLLIFGIGERSSVALVAIGVFFIALYNTMGGVLNLPASYRDVGSSFGARRGQYIRLIALPGALPHIFTGIKLSVGIGLLLIVAAEFVGTRTGIGYLVWSSWEVFAVERMFVGLLLLGLLGYITNMAMDALERRLIPWREQ
ncbi:ABC transporter permease [Iamia sp.]|uniref:ABC transporter permease n=1 Tax=Iamia sp. TaxID=2722710 RepID=UPI002CE47F80|nr:ABC transporter permease [Iamia sp.]HXH58619.1 ABC transporter permease [Iamia sp.]